MKKIFITFLLLLVIKPICSFGQSQDYVNQTKYWFFRNRLINEFMKVGPGQGESLPLMRINRSEEMGDSRDGLVRPAGIYIGVLATELYILKKAGQDTYQTRLELYYALNAIKRLDETAESYNFCDTEFNDPVFSPPANCIGTGNDWNGFLIRDDIDCSPSSNMTKYFRTKMSDSKFKLITQFGSNLVVPPTTPECLDARHTTNNDISHDQLNNLFIGLRIVQTFLDGTETFTPPGGLPDVNLRDFSKTIATKIFDWMVFSDGTLNQTNSDNCDYLVRSYGTLGSTFDPTDLCGKNSPFVFGNNKKRWIPWLIMNPVTKQPAGVSNNGAGYPFQFSEGYARTGQLLTGNPYDIYVNSDAKTIWYGLPAFNFYTNSENYKIMGQATLSNSWNTPCYGIILPCFEVKHFLGIPIPIPISGSDCGCLGLRLDAKRIIDQNATLCHYEFFALLYNVLYSTNGYYGTDYDPFFQSVLNSAPCIGPHYSDGDKFPSDYQWASVSMLWEASKGDASVWWQGNSNNAGEYNALDYMLMYNLQNIYHRNYSYYTNYADNLKINNRVIDNTKEYYNARSYHELDFSQYYNGFIDVQNSTIQNGSSVDIRAGQKITFKPPFKVQAGSALKGYIYQPPTGNWDWEMTICSHFDATGQPDGHRLAADPNVYNYLTDSTFSNSFLGNNFPNPFNNTTIIPYFVSEGGSVQLNVIDSYGRLIQELVNKNDHTIGHFTIEFNSNNLANGVYFYSLKTKDRNDIKRMVIIN
jgi:hypothetical protein